MKFTIVVVMLALAVGAQSSVLPLWAAPTSYTAVHGPTVLAAHPGLVLAHPHAAVAVHAVHAAPVLVAAPAPVLVAGEGTYVAKTRGAVHVAPLPGHLNSAASINLEAAPGTL